MAKEEIANKAKQVFEILKRLSTKDALHIYKMPKQMCHPTAVLSFQLRTYQLRL
jgi:hypothetical protein